MAESNVQVPWFSGLCLEGAVAGQYEIERSASQQVLEGTKQAGLLALDGLAPITIFVGANNSGKSRLLRELFKTQQPRWISLPWNGDNTESQSCSDAAKLIDKARQWIPSQVNVSALSELGERAIGPCGEGWIEFPALIHLDAVSKELDIGYCQKPRPGNDLDEAAKHDSLCDWLRQYKSLISQRDIKRINNYQSLRRCYVPILRGMRPPLLTSSERQDNVTNKDLYEKRTVHDYFKDLAAGPRKRDEDSPRQKIFTGLTLYDNLRRRLLGRTQAERKTVRDYECFLSQHFFPGQTVTLIPVEEGNNDVVHIKIGNTEERPIYDLGDGMQSLIICTYPIVTDTERDSLFFLEEPDLCMHPSLQRMFLEVLKTYHRKMGHQFFLTTHSNHLLDLLEDNKLVSIFSFSQIESGSLLDSAKSTSDTALNSSPPAPRFRIRASNLRDRQTLLELGVRPSATFLANATIWVEGISDCAYLRAYMEAFVQYLQTRGDEDLKSLATRLDQYKEDRHYAFVEYSGGNLTHFSFTTNTSEEGQDQANRDRVANVPDLCATAIVLADGDVKGKAERELVFAQELNERFIVLPCKEIENMIPEALMKKQIERDHTRPNQGSFDQSKLNSICYDTYARSDEGIGGVSR